MVNHAPLSMCLCCVTLHFRVVIPLGVSTPFSQASFPWLVSDFWGNPEALVQAGFPPQSVSPAWGTLGPKFQPACQCAHLSLTECNTSQTSSGKAGWGHLECNSPINSSVPFWTSYCRVNRRNVCVHFARFSAKDLHLNPPPLAISSCTWELAVITAPLLLCFFTNSCLWTWSLLELDNL